MENEHATPEDIAAVVAAAHSRAERLRKLAAMLESVMCTNAQLKTVMQAAHELRQLAGDAIE